MKDINQYGKHVVKLWFPAKMKRVDPSLTVMSLGLGGESGEVQEHIKKYVRDGVLDRPALKKELGDVVYYWARICKYFGFTLSSVIDGQIAKCKGRRKRGTVRGNGDNR